MESTENTKDNKSSYEEMYANENFDEYFVNTIIREKEKELKNDYEVYIPDEVMTKITQYITRINELCGEKELLPYWILETLLMAGKKDGIYSDDASDFIRQLFPNVENEICSLVFKLTEIMTGEEGMWSSKDIPEGESKRFVQQYRAIIDREVTKIFYPGEFDTNDEMFEDECDIIGDIVEPTNNMSIE